MEAVKEYPYCFVGEAWGRVEHFKQRPFQGASGEVLNEIFEAAGIPLRSLKGVGRFSYYEGEVPILNVFNFQPPANKIDYFFHKRAGVNALYPDIKPGQITKYLTGKEAPPSELSHLIKYPPFEHTGGKLYLKKSWFSELEKLKRNLEIIKPKVIFALGATALWALTGRPKISINRGYLIPCSIYPDAQVLATYHPASLLYTGDKNRHVVVRDIMKGVEESGESTSTMVEMTVHLIESVEDLDRIPDAPIVAIDTETQDHYIRCLTIATSAKESYAIPLLKFDGTPVWNDADFVKVLWRIKKYIESRKRVIFHNAPYDVAYLDDYGIDIPDIEDTMILAHAIDPIDEKSLGALGAQYFNVPAFKAFSTRHDNKKEN